MMIKKSAHHEQMFVGTVLSQGRLCISWAIHNLRKT